MKTKFNVNILTNDAEIPYRYPSVYLAIINTANRKIDGVVNCTPKIYCLNKLARIANINKPTVIQISFTFLL